MFKVLKDICTVINDMMAVFLGVEASFSVVTKDKKGYFNRNVFYFYKDVTVKHEGHVSQKWQGHSPCRHE